MASRGTAIAFVSIFSLGGVIAFGMLQNNGNANLGPNATDDNAILSPGKNSVTVYVLDNDFDRSGRGLYIEKVSDPAHGSALIDGDSAVTYSLDDAGFVGDESFTYVVRDENNRTDSARVIIGIRAPEAPVEESAKPKEVPTANDEPRVPLTDLIALPSEDQIQEPKVIPPPELVQQQPAGRSPVADAGDSLTVDEGTHVVLTGSRSYDPDGDDLSYSWTQIRGPGVKISDSDSETASFLAPKLGQGSSITLAFDLTVDDGITGSDTDTIQIVVENTEDNNRPVADAGDDVTAIEGSAVSLDGTRSSDPDGDEIDYSWSQIDGPEVEFTSTSASPTFRAPIIDSDGDVTLTFTLVVDDGRESDSDRVKVTVENEVTNERPVADAGPTQRVEQDATVTLDGSGSSDPDGTSLAFLWTQTSGPEVSLSDNSIAKPTFDAPSVSQLEQLTFKLTVSDGHLTSTDVVDIFVAPPIIHKILATPDYMKDVAKEIANAKFSVHAAMYFAEPYDGNKVIDELVKAVDRGVDVKLTFDNETILLYPTVESDMKELGIPYKVVSNHAKVVVIDNSILYVGSANWNDNGLENNWELNLKTTDPETVEEASEFVDAVWNTGNKKVDYTDTGSERFVNGPEFFDLLLDYLSEADSVKILMYQVSYSPLDPNAPDTILMNELKDMNTRGVDIELLLDDPGYYERYNGRHFLEENGISHRLDSKNTGPMERMHAKGILIDDDILIIGSQNWNAESLDSAQEASIITSDPETINDFLDIFNEQWDAGHEPESFLDGALP